MRHRGRSHPEHGDRDPFAPIPPRQNLHSRAVCRPLAYACVIRARHARDRASRVLEDRAENVVEPCDVRDAIHERDVRVLDERAHVACGHCAHEELRKPKRERAEDPCRERGPPRTSKGDQTLDGVRRGEGRDEGAGARGEGGYEVVACEGRDVWDRSIATPLGASGICGRGRGEDGGLRDIDGGMRAWGAPDVYELDADVVDFKEFSADVKELVQLGVARPEDRDTRCFVGGWRRMIHGQVTDGLWTP